MSKRSHYVPRCLLRGFSSVPSDENPPLFALSKGNGEIRQTAANTVALVRDYNRLEGSYGLDPDHVEEGLFSLIEDHAAPIIRLMVQRHDVSPEDRVTFAVFLHVQHTRTPRQRTLNTYMHTQVVTALVHVGLNDPDRVRQVLSTVPEATRDSTVEEWIAKTRSQLDDGELKVTPAWDHEVINQFIGVPEVAHHIAHNMTWYLQTTTADRPFVLADHPICFYDQRSGRATGSGWDASPMMQITLPLTSTACLLLAPGKPEPLRASGPVHPETVTTVNRRSFAGAEWDIFAEDAATLVGLKSDVNMHPDEIKLLTPPNIQASGLEDLGGAPPPTTVRRGRAKTGKSR